MTGLLSKRAPLPWARHTIPPSQAVTDCNIDRFPIFLKCDERRRLVPFRLDVPGQHRRHGFLRAQRLSEASLRTFPSQFASRSLTL